MTLDQRIASALTADEAARVEQDEATEIWASQLGELFFQPGVLERLEAADRSRMRTFEALQALLWERTREARGGGVTCLHVTSRTRTMKILYCGASAKRCNGSLRCSAHWPRTVG